MQTQGHLAQLKKSFFTGLTEMRCFDLHSHSILWLICLIRFITEITAINLRPLISDHWFEYLFIAEEKLSIFKTLQTNSILLCGIIILLLVCLVYLYCLLTFEVVGKQSRKKIVFMKIFCLIIYTFRAFLIKALSQIIFVNFQAAKMEWVALSSLLIFFITVVMLILEQFYVSISFQSNSKSLLIKTPHPFNTISEGILLISIFLSQLLSTENIIYTAVLCLSFILSYALKLMSSALRKKYPDFTMDLIESVHCISGIIFYLLIVPGYYIQLLKQNLLISDIIIIIFSFASYSNYLNAVRNQGIGYLESSFKSKQELQSRKGKFYLFQAHYLIHYINYLMNEFKGEKEQILLTGIFSQHVRGCKNPQCYCNRVTSTNTIQKLIIEKQFRGQFLLSFVENIYNEFSHQFAIFSIYLMFKLQVLGIFPQIEHLIVTYESIHHSHLSIGQEFIIFQVRRSLKKTIEYNNRNFSSIKLQKVIIEEQKCKYLVKLMKSIIQSTIKKYRLLGEAIVNLKLVQENNNKTCEMIKQIQLNYMNSINKNTYNLYTQSLFHQYFTCISETNSQAALILSNILTKSNALKSIKGITIANMDKILYEENCCIIETGLEPDNMGRITNLNENSYNVFGIKKEELIHQNIKKIIPKHFNQEHQRIMKIWLSTASYQNINTLKNIYLTNHKGTAFKSLVYHQITTSMDRVKLYVMVLKMPGDNFLLVDETMKIQGFGQKIKDSILTLKALREPLQNYCLNTKSLPEDLNSLDTDKQYKIDLLLCDQKQNYGGEMKAYDPNANFAQQIQQFAIKALRKNKQIRVLKCKISMYVATFGRTKYLVMRLIDVIEHTMLQGEIDQIEQNSQFSMTGLQTSKIGTQKNLGRQKILLGENSFTMKNIEQSPENNGNVEMDDDNYEETTTLSNSEEDHLMKNYQLHQMQKQSVSSISRQSTSYSFKKLIKLIKQKFLLEKNVTYRELNNVTLILALLVIAIITALVVQYIFYKARLQSFEKIINANQQVSDTLQYVELMFSESMIIYHNCIILAKDAECQKAVKTISFSYNTLFEHVSTHTQNFMTSKMTQDFPFYDYLNQAVKVNFGNNVSQMGVQQFLSIFYYSVKKIAQHFQTQRTMNLQMQKAYSILTANWDLIVQINHEVLTVFQDKGLQQMETITTILYVISGTVIIFHFFLVFSINYFISKSIDQKERLIRNYEFIPISYVQQLKRYFETLLQELNMIKSNQLQIRNSQFPTIQDNAYYRPKGQFFYNRSFAKRMFLLFLFFVCLTVSNLFSFNEMYQVLGPFETIFVEESLMIKSQKSIIETFYEVKMNYILIKNETIRAERLSILESKFQKRQVEFNDKSIKLLQIFNDPNGQYFQDFKHLIKDDMCQISKEIITDWQYDACKKAFFEYPKFGIFSSMNMIQRISMILFYIMKTLPLPVGLVYLSKPIYQDIDLYIIYAVKVFFLMENRINQQMQVFLQDAYFACLMMILLQIVLLTFGIFTWIWFSNKKKKQFIKLYGHVIIFPNQVITKNKLVMKSIEQGLSIKDY